jgi:syntenin-1
MAKEQVKMAAKQQALAGAADAMAATGGGASAVDSMYGDLMQELNQWGGLEITPQVLQQHMSEDAVALWTKPEPIVAVTPASDLGIQRADIKKGVRQVILAKGQEGKLGVAVACWDKGVFVAFVWKDSAAALGGLRFGDQILQINGETVAGWTQKQTLKFITEADATRVTFAVVDRPMMRTVTCQKDASNHVGFLFKDGMVKSIIKDTSAARNGLMINHQVIEINGQCVVGLKDKELSQLFQESPRTCTVTITPKFVYDHLVAKIGFKKIKKHMDHGIPEL